MKNKDFIGKLPVVMGDVSTAVIVNAFVGQGFERVFEKQIWGYDLIFRKKLEPKKFKGKHNYWGTHGQDRFFTAVPRYINVSVGLNKGYNQGEDKSLWDREQFHGRVTLRGGIAYKYSRNQKEQLEQTEEIYNYYHYDTNVLNLIAEMNESIKRVTM